MTPTKLQQVIDSDWFRIGKRVAKGELEMDIRNMPFSAEFLAAVVQEIAHQPQHPLWRRICQRYKTSAPSGTGKILKALGLSEDALICNCVRLRVMPATNANQKHDLFDQRGLVARFGDLESVLPDHHPPISLDYLFAH